MNAPPDSGSIPADLETRAIRRVGWRIVPFVMACYLVAFLDRVNIGFGALTMNTDIGLSSTMFGLGAAVFFIGYLAFEVPSNLILYRIGARLWIGSVMITWGLVSAAMVLVSGPRSFYAVRFLLGLAEAGFFPGIILYLGYWFPARHRAVVTAWFMAAAPLAGFIGAPLSATLLQLHGWMGLKGWQWMFLLEALPAIVLGSVAFARLTDSPAQADWLERDERRWLTREMSREQAARGSNSRHSIRGAMTDPRVLALSLAYFGTSAGLYTVGIWAPQIIKAFHLSIMRIGLLTAIPNLVAIVGMLLWSRHSDRTGERHWHAALACLIAAAGMVLAASGRSLWVAILGLSFTAVGVSAAKPPLWTLPTTFLAGSGAAAGIGLINSFGNLGGAAGPYLIGVARDSSGSYARGLLFVGGSLLVSALVLLLLKRSSRAPATA